MKKVFVVLGIFIVTLLSFGIIFKIYKNSPEIQGTSVANFDEIASKTNEKSIADIYTCDRNQKCMDEITEKLLKKKTTVELLSEIDDLGKKDEKFLLQCHPVVHSIGRVTFTSSRNLGEAFQKCSHVCHSGCYHGAMERLFLGDKTYENKQEGGYHVNPDEINKKIPIACEDFAQEDRGNLRFQCLHGLGHAVVYFYEYDLINSLKACDLLNDAWSKDSCYGGAFMENVFPAVKEKGMINSDPHFPCNAVDEKYKGTCYLMQTSRMLQLGMNYDNIAKECENAGKNGKYRLICMQSLGRDASNDARRDVKSKEAQICARLGTSEDSEYCIKGLVYALTDNSWDGRFAFPYCDNLPRLNDLCYKATISHLLNSLYIPKTEVLKSCELYSLNKECKTIVREG